MAKEAAEKDTTEYWECPINVPRWRDSKARMRMSLAERGLYLEMILYQWAELDCPSDLAELARVVAASEADVSSCLPKVRQEFSRVSGDRLQNAYLEGVRERKTDKRAASSPENGRKGGRPRKPKLEPNENLTKPTVISNSVIPNSISSSDSPDDFQATLEALKDEHPGSYRADECGRALANLTSKGYSLEDILIAHREAQKAWKTRIPPDLERWLWTYSPGNKLVGFDTDKKPKSALAAMEGL